MEDKAELHLRRLLKDDEENFLINLLWGFRQGIYKGNHKFSEEFLALARSELKKLNEEAL